jgi:hypothetical protein
MSAGHFEVGEHDIPPGVTVCYVKDSRTGQIVRDGLDIDRAEAIADGMNEDSAWANSARDEGEDLGCC